MAMQEGKKSRYNVRYTNPLTDKQFIEGMKIGYFVKSPDHEALITFLHYSAVRISEALSLKRSRFRIVDDMLFVDIGKRLKHSKETPPWRFL